jgi:hydrogenase nickel incorporation protein HypA/HybF
MHELSIALSMIDAVLEAREQHAGRVEAIHVRLGPLSGVDRSAFEFAYEVARDGTPLATTKLLVEESAIEFECSRCLTIRNLAAMQPLACPVCGTPAEKIMSGRELEITALEIIEDEPAATG